MYLYAIRRIVDKSLVTKPCETDKGAKIAHTRGVRSGKYPEEKGLELVRFKLEAVATFPYAAPLPE